METKFPKFPEDMAPHQWSHFFHAGTQWIKTYELLNELMAKKENGDFLFYVYPYAIGFSMELFIKALVAHEDNTFTPKDFRHETTKIINQYADSIPILGEIAKDLELMTLIKSFESTVDTKFGDTIVSMNGEDTKKIVDAIFKIRNEMCKKTKLP